VPEIGSQPRLRPEDEMWAYAVTGLTWTAFFDANVIYKIRETV
jgi:hypothetical protein